MPQSPGRLLTLCEEIEGTPHERLLEMDRETLLGIQKSLRELKQKVDRTLLRLAFVDERQLN